MRGIAGGGRTRVRGGRGFAFTAASRVGILEVRYDLDEPFDGQLTSSTSSSVHGDLQSVLDQPFVVPVRTQSPFWTKQDLVQFFEAPSLLLFADLEFGRSDPEGFQSSSSFVVPFVDVRSETTFVDQLEGLDSKV